MSNAAQYELTDPGFLSMCETEYYSHLSSTSDFPDAEVYWNIFHDWPIARRMIVVNIFRSSRFDVGKVLGHSNFIFNFGSMLSPVLLSCAPLGIGNNLGICFDNLKKLNLIAPMQREIDFNGTRYFSIGHDEQRANLLFKLLVTMHDKNALAFFKDEMTVSTPFFTKLFALNSKDFQDFQDAKLRFPGSDSFYKLLFSVDKVFELFVHCPIVRFFASLLVLDSTVLPDLSSFKTGGLSPVLIVDIFEGVVDSVQPFSDVETFDNILSDDGRLCAPVNEIKLRTVPGFNDETRSYLVAATPDVNNIIDPSDYVHRGVRQAAHLTDLTNNKVFSTRINDSLGTLCGSPFTVSISESIRSAPAVVFLSCSVDSPIATSVCCLGATIRVDENNFDDIRRKLPSDESVLPLSKFGPTVLSTKRAGVIVADHVTNNIGQGSSLAPFLDVDPGNDAGFDFVTKCLSKCKSIGDYPRSVFLRYAPGIYYSGSRRLEMFAESMARTYFLTIVPSGDFLDNSVILRFDLRSGLANTGVFSSELYGAFKRSGGTLHKLITRIVERKAAYSRVLARIVTEHKLPLHVFLYLAHLSRGESRARFSSCLAEAFAPDKNNPTCVVANWSCLFDDQEFVKINKLKLTYLSKNKGGQKKSKKKKDILGQTSISNAANTFFTTFSRGS